MSRAISISLALVCLAACSAGAEPIVQEVVVEQQVTVEVEIPVTRLVEVEVTRQVEVEVTRELEVTRQMEVTVLVERPVTVTPTPTPVNTPTPSNTPTITPTPTASSTPTVTPTPTRTPDFAQTATTEALGVMTAPKGSGFYLVGVDIAPGKWESTGRGDGCYWARADESQDLLDNHYGTAGGTVTIRQSDFQVEFDDCGTWYYVEGADRPLADDATEPKGNGFFTVGVEIAAGKWRSTGTGDGCYWSRLDGYQNILDNHFGMSGGTVTLWTSDYEVNFNDCGTWEYLGP